MTPYFDDLPPYKAVEEEEKGSGLEGDEFAEPLLQEDKPKLSIVVELLANGYILNEKIMENARGFDERHGISQTFQRYFSRGKALDEQFHVTETGGKIVHEAAEKAKVLAQGIDEKFQIQKRAQDVDQKYHVTEKLEGAKKLAEQAASSETGQKIQSYFSYLWGTAQTTLEEAKKKAIEKNPEMMARSSVAPTITEPTPSAPPQTSFDLPEKA